VCSTIVLGTHCLICNTWIAIIPSIDWIPNNQPTRFMSQRTELFWPINVFMAFLWLCFHQQVNWSFYTVIKSECNRRSTEGRQHQIFMSLFYCRLDCTFSSEVLVSIGFTSVRNPDGKTETSQFGLHLYFWHFIPNTSSAFTHWSTYHCCWVPLRPSDSDF
jgi:hypothetical protein